MTDASEIQKVEIQHRVVVMWLGGFCASSGYVAKRLGKKGRCEFQDMGAHQVAETFRRLEVEERDDGSVMKISSL